MLLPDKSGIACDSCGGQHRHEFKYYSLDLRPVSVKDNARPRELGVQPILSLDLCQSCWSVMGQRVAANYKAVVGGIVCDLTGRLMVGTYEYYEGDVTGVGVQVAGGTANTTTERNVAQLCISPEAFGEMQTRLLETRKAASAWSSTVSSHPGPSPKKPNTTHIP